MSSTRGRVSFSNIAVCFDTLQHIKKKTSTLQFSGCTAEDWFEISQRLMRFTRITSLCVSNCLADDSITKVISKMIQLVHLRLDGNRICDSGVERLSSLINLKTISLQRNPRTKAHSLAYLTNNIPGLTYIGMEKDCQQFEASHIHIGDVGIKLICPNLINLKSLFLWNTTISAEGCIYISRLLRSLTSLSLCFNNSCDQGAIMISRNLICLTSLDLSKAYCYEGCTNITLISLMELMKNLRNLKKMKILQKPYSTKGRYRIHVKARLKCYNNKVHIEI